MFDGVEALLWAALPSDLMSNKNHHLAMFEPSRRCPGPEDWRRFSADVVETTPTEQRGSADSVARQCNYDNQEVNVFRRLNDSVTGKMDS